ncbi:MAG: hypothetical protein LBH07_07845, partial [Treponema sp.]|nr:hypothetical protein [Treponema sp.]
KVFINVFAWPPLFRIKTGFDRLYRFKHFSGSKNESFSLNNGDGNTLVIPETPFCITDKRPFLTEAGFRRFILDFSGGTFNGSFPLKKKLYKEVMKAAQDGSLLTRRSQGFEFSGISRFNWKDGFFTQKSEK